MDEGIVLRRRPDVAPDRPESLPRPELWAGYMHVVVPDQCALPCRLVGEENCGKQGGRNEAIRKVELARWGRPFGSVSASAVVELAPSLRGRFCGDFGFACWLISAIPVSGDHADYTTQNRFHIRR